MYFLSEVRKPLAYIGFELIKKKIHSSAHAFYECNNLQFTQTGLSSTS